MDTKHKFEILIIFISIIIITLFEIFNGDKYKDAIQSGFGVGSVSLAIIVLCFYIKMNNTNYSNPLTAIIIIVLLSTYVQLLISTQKKTDSTCENNEKVKLKVIVYNDDISENKGKEKLAYTIFYIIMLIIILLTMLNMQDSNSDSLEKAFKGSIWGKEIDLLGFINDKKKYLPYIVYTFPLILPLITELINYGSNASNESIFTSFILGSTPEKFEWSNFKNATHAVITSGYILLFVWYIFSHSGLIPNMFLTPLTETAIRLILILLILFPLVMKYIFIQRCAIEEIEEKENQISCEISKYGGILLLVILTLIISFIHSLKITEIKSFYLFIIISASIAGGFILNIIKPINV